MRVVIQRVAHASVTINNAIYSEIGKGYLVLVGCENADTNEDIEDAQETVSYLGHLVCQEGRTQTFAGGEQNNRRIIHIVLMTGL